MNDIILDHQILIDELSTVGVVSHNATHFGCRQKYIFRFLCSEKIANGLLIGQVFRMAEPTSPRCPAMYIFEFDFMCYMLIKNRRCESENVRKCECEIKCPIFRGAFAC